MILRVESASLSCCCLTVDLASTYAGGLGSSTPCSSAVENKIRLQQSKRKYDLTGRVPEVSDKTTDDDNEGNEV